MLPGSRRTWMPWTMMHRHHICTVRPQLQKHSFFPQVLRLFATLWVMMDLLISAPKGFAVKLQRYPEWHPSVLLCQGPVRRQPSTCHNRLIHHHQHLDIFTYVAHIGTKKGSLSTPEAPWNGMEKIAIGTSLPGPRQTTTIDLS